MYAKGDGIPQDYKKAIEWYLKAANQIYDSNDIRSTGISYAQYNLGQMYAKGEGVPRNTVIALEWFKKGCNNEDEDSCDQYVLLSR